jgi:carboxypeptidase Taq
LTVASASTPVERLRAQLAEISDLLSTEALLGWDSRVFMPRAGAESRAGVSATIGRLAHERFVTDEIGELLETAAEDVEPGSVDAALVRVARRDWNRYRCVPPELTGELNRAAGIAVAAWDEAKAAGDFPAFAPYLEEQLELKRRYIDCFPTTDDPYDVLLEDYEEGMTTERVAAIFNELKPALKGIVDEVGAEHARIALPTAPFPVDAQMRASELVLRAFGTTEDGWRLDETPHPFATSPGAGDVRLTTRYDEGDLVGLFATMHEFGHGLYEWSVDRSLARSPLGCGTSSALHEAQSRTWENLVGRSRGFWRWFFPDLEALLPDAVRGLDAESFYRAVTAVRPGPVRGDADEVTYGLHIILRFEIERRLLSGSLAVADLPDAWNTLVREYLGVDVPDVAHGALQDTHWAIGLFGYFPTYQLGNVVSVQIWDRLRDDLGDPEGDFEAGEFGRVREWLAEHVYRHGRIYPPRELLERITGADVDPAPYLAYLRAKVT